MGRQFLQIPMMMALCVASPACSSDSSDDGPGSTPGGPSSEQSMGGSTMGAAGADTATPFLRTTMDVDPADRTVRPSPGCDSGAAGATGEGTLTLTSGAVAEYFIGGPASDATDPRPLAFVFHGANNTHIDCRDGGNCGGVRRAVEAEAITVYMRSLAPSWTEPMLEENIQWFDEMLDHVKNNYCVDERRVVSIGTSSGAHFSNILACRRGNDLMAVVPGAGEAWVRDDCEGHVAALVIHGIDDTSVTLDKGESARDWYAERNGCEQADATAMHQVVRDARDAGENATECIDFQGCDEGLPVRWCEHSEGGYDGSTHGWPSQGGPLAVEFMQSLY